MGITGYVGKEGKMGRPARALSPRGTRDLTATAASASSANLVPGMAMRGRVKGAAHRIARSFNIPYIYVER